ncbi:hypothetical protein PR202_ga15243 [Eleusine coracana subsp. coracana]|uniref:RING-type E3 ubiquitin transferase n=1 Tax=Eleusine coracana subsp. coracana TaxID=191504 RepID=A0AAV5CIT4_ELECO|nr:hypothetical protein QOZ80_6BG0495270 [Eleusine coracana subsp. coracana]GJM98253.1 hypothetical protein PR202_ga15243 [Eleusine coracana subsp. coracana]
MSIDLTPSSPPRRGRRSPPPPDDWQSYPYPWPLPPPTDEPSTSPGKVIVSVVVGVGATLIVLSILCSICQRMRPGNGAASRPAAARAAATVAAPPRAPSVVALSDSDDDEECGRPRARSTAGLPSFTYSPSLKQNLTGSEEEAAACAVCLGEFGVGETVRLLPACLHLYHVDCIDPWLHAHSTCPICRSGTDLDRLPPV